jgi:hypothetical protein
MSVPQQPRARLRKSSRYNVAMRTIAVLLVVAVAAAAGGYALGAQRGGGTAAAHPRVAGHHRLFAPARHRPQRVAAVARRLGVTPERLRAALVASRCALLAERRRPLVVQLARRLGLPELRVESALTPRRCR